MASAASPGPTLDRLLQFISKVVLDHFTETRQRTNGAYLAEKIRAEFPGFSYEQVGLTRLSDAVAKAEETGLIVRHRDVKHLELSPGPATGLTKSVALTSSRSCRPLYVRSDIWRAFAFVAPDQRYFLDSITNEVVSTSSTESPPTDDQNAERYAPIQPIPVEEQRRWMREYAESKESLDVFDSPISDPQCYLRFPEWIQRVAPELAKDWRQFRTQRVVEFVKSWVSRNQVSAEGFFAPTRSRREFGVEFTSESGGEDLAREAIIAVVREMPLEDLERLAIPLRYVLRHFKPR